MESTINDWNIYIKMKFHIQTLLKGMAMGAADVVPGVSGGTIAFITGIYERLLNALKSINFSRITQWRKEGLNSVWQQIDGTFLITLFIGVFISLLSLAKVLKWTLTNYPQLLWSFFFGLIIASAIFIIKQVKWSVPTSLMLVCGFSIALGITLISPGQAPDNYSMVFISGFIAICAMILPGISGSFILLLMGMYSNILGAVNDMNISLLLVFILGCILGLLCFSHFLSWTFKHYKNSTLALLAGFMIGSLNKVWPWQNIIELRKNSHGEMVPWMYENCLPNQYQNEPMLFMCIGLFIVGLAIVFILELFSPKDE